MQEDPLEKEMATHSSILAWEIPWTEEPGGLQSMGLQKNQTHLSDQTTEQRTYIRCDRGHIFQGFKKKKKISMYTQSHYGLGTWERSLVFEELLVWAHRKEGF